MSELPSEPKVASGDGASTPKPSWQKHLGILLRWRSVQSALVLTAIATLGSSGYLFYHYKHQKTLEAHIQNDRPVVAIIDAAIEAVDEETLNLTLQLKNVTAKTAYSLVISVVGFNPATERGRQLATITGTDPMPSDVSFSSNASIKRTEMLPVVVLCLLYADEGKRGFTEHLYYDALGKPQVDDRVELRKLSSDSHNRVDNLKVCRL